MGANGAPLGEGAVTEELRVARDRLEADERGAVRGCPGPVVARPGAGQGGDEGEGDGSRGRGSVHGMSEGKHHAPAFCPRANDAPLPSPSSGDGTGLFHGSGLVYLAGL